MKTTLLLGGFLLCIMSGVMLSGLTIGVFLQPAAALMVLLPVAFYLLYSYGSGVGRFLRRAVCQELEADDSPVIDTACTLGFMFGIFAMIVGFAVTMGNLPDSSKLGSGIAISIISNSCCFFS